MEDPFVVAFFVCEAFSPLEANKILQSMLVGAIIRLQIQSVSRIVVYCGASTSSGSCIYDDVFCPQRNVRFYEMKGEGPGSLPRYRHLTETYDLSHFRVSG